MTRAGLLAMLRRLHGSPVLAESLVSADVHASNVSEEQAQPRSPDAEWPERP